MEDKKMIKENIQEEKEKWNLTSCGKCGDIFVGKGLENQSIIRFQMNHIRSCRRENNEEFERFEYV